MTLAELRRLLAVLSNQCFARYRIDFRRTPETTLMAFCCVNYDGSPASLHEPDLEREGFVRERRDGLEFWIIRRVDEEGDPWRSRLPPG